MNKVIGLGFSPCPNDTFIFDALVHGKIDTGEYSFQPQLEDVETLNLLAMEHKLPVTKVSYGVLPNILDRYRILNSGSALGSGVGPLFIKKAGEQNIEIADTSVAIPGKNTTAHLLFSLAYPQVKSKIFLRYDEIEKFVLDGKGFGVIIHENRFTYQDRGLEKIQDLGEFWEKKSGFAIPLGGIVISRDFAPGVQADIDGLVKKSIEYSFAHYPHLSDYIKENAQEMSEDVMRKHIDLYVNKYSLALGEEGKKAIRELLEVQLNGHHSINDLFV